MKEDIAIEALREVKEIFDKHGIVFWLDFGTLLGAVRESKFISWDHDIDLGAWCKEGNEIFSACMELEKGGFRIIWGHSMDSSLTPFHISIFKKEGRVGIGIWLYYLNDNSAIIEYSIYQHAGLLCNLFMFPQYVDVYRLSYLTKILLKINYLLPYPLREKVAKFLHFVAVKMGWHKKVLFVVPYNYFKNLATIKFYGMEFNIPSKAEEYLVYKYGKDWKIPKKGYIPHKEDGTICTR